MRTFAFLLAAAAAFSLVPLASGSELAFPGKAGTLVFQSNRSGNSELYVAKASGTGVRKLLSRPKTEESFASWSPSGRRIVFLTGPADGSNYDVWIADADGRNAAPLVKGKTNDLWAQFCRESVVLFTRQLNRTNYEIFSVRTDGKALRNLTKSPAADFTPTCSPDGKTVYFTSDRDGSQRIYSMTPGGKNVRPLTEPGAIEPDVSPDGKSLAYVKRDAQGDLEAFVRYLSTGATRQITDASAPVEHRFPKYTPGGGQIIVTRRDAQSGQESLQQADVKTGAAKTLVGDGSLGSVQGVPCECERLIWLAGRISGASYSEFKRERDPDRMQLRIIGSAALTCAQGVGQCQASVSLTVPTAMQRLGVKLVPLGPLTGSSAGLQLLCTGPCGRRQPNTVFGMDLVGGPRLGFTRRGVETRSITLLAVSTCGKKQVTSEVTIVFDDGGDVDFNRSDWDGDGIPDGPDEEIVVSVGG